MRRRLSDDTYEFIKGEVVNVFEKCNINTIPIDGLELAKRLQIPLVGYSELAPKKKDAALCFSSDGFTFQGSEKTKNSLYGEVNTCTN